MSLLPYPMSSPTEPEITDSGSHTVSGRGGSGRFRRQLEAGTSVGRYVVRRRLGAGGMGEVFAAHDAELDRDVALKLIHTRDSHDDEATLRECERLRNEAQALAKLSHPNVVQIYEVGRHDGQTFLAMELVSGPTLGEWRASSLAELIAVYVQAGRGLAAAHAAGLAHRDFKPGNVIVGDDGRVRVLDFGLAKPSRQIVEASTTVGDESDDPRPRSSSSIGGPGTLPYMAPEQAFSGTGGPAADQFSFCVALFEAIYGMRPFAAKGVMELLVKLESCTLEFPSEPPRLGHVPRWLRKLLARGLARHPEDRFASMEDLLAELAKDRRRVWRRLAFAASVSAVTALTMLAIVPGQTTATAAPQSDPADEWAAVWGPEQREAIHEGFAAIDRPWASGSEAAVIAGLDAWSSRWIAVAREAQDTRDPLRLRSIDACLASQRTQAESTIAALSEGDGVLLEGAVAAIDALPEPSHCTIAPHTALALIDQGELLPQLHALADATAQRHLGRFELARTSAEAVLREAKAKGWTSVELAALRQHALASIEAGARAQGIAELEQARNLAVRSQDRQTEAELWVDLAWAGRKLDNAALRRDRLALAQAHVDALRTDQDEVAEHGRHVALLGARVQLAVALDLLKDPERLADAEQLLLDGLQLEATHGSLLAIDYQHGLARVREQAGQLEQAEQDYQRAIALAEELRGEGHPSNARVYYDAAALAHQRGELGLARERMTRARDLRRAALRVDHPEHARSELGLAQLELSEGNVALARSHAEQALHVLEQVGEGDPRGDQDPLGETLRVLGQLEASAQRWSEAAAYYERALPLTEGLQHALVELELGKALSVLGQHARAVELLDGSLPILADVLGPTGCHQLVISYERHADALAGLGQPQRAAASIAAALACARDDDTRARLQARLP